jgi:hypothetical protein
VAVDAAAVEPVSAAKFPANREKNGEFYAPKQKSSLDEVFGMHNLFGRQQPQILSWPLLRSDFGTQNFIAVTDETQCWP